MTILSLYLGLHSRIVFQSSPFVGWVILQRKSCKCIAYGESGRVSFHSWSSKGTSLGDLIGHCKFQKS